MQKLRWLAAAGVVLLVLAAAAFVEIARISPVPFGLQCMAENVYWESHNEPYLGQEMVAYVTWARAKDNRSRWGGSTLCGVVFYAKHHASGRITPAFSWTTGPAAHAYPQKWWQWARAVYIAASMDISPQAPDKRFREARYYLNVEASQTRDACWFEKSLIKIGAIGKHEFWRKPRPKEKIPKSQLTGRCKPPPKPRRKPRARTIRPHRLVRRR